MRQLTTCQDGAYAAQLQLALQTAGIVARVTTETRNAYLGGNLFVLWVDDDADPAAVRRICSSFIAPDTGEPKLPPTRVSWSESVTKCLVCGYDLRGQVQDGKCPECAHPYILITERRCPACHADVPSDFELCWKCGREIPPPAPSDS